MAQDDTEDRLSVVDFQAGWDLLDGSMRKMYATNAFGDCSALQTMLMYRHAIQGENNFIESVSGLRRYDYMQQHSSGESGVADDGKTLIMTDAERHRMTLGVTLGVRNPYFPTEIHVNYENYRYLHGGAKESEQDKISV
ncbi:MAG: hypothetical protein ACI30V_03895 [Muribaculaceae bacterium]